MKTPEAQARIESLRKEILELDARRVQLQEMLRQLESVGLAGTPPSAPSTSFDSQQEKIALFRSLFRGREDVFPKRFESRKTGKSGDQPVCRNEWIRPVCRKPNVKCRDCEARDFVPMSDEVVRSHLIGVDPADRYAREFVIGVYPMLPDETCRFLAVDFDRSTWREDAAAFVGACCDFEVPAALERSRSGNGGHVWIFFSEPVQARLARQLGAFMLTRAMERQPEIGFGSYDRFFPSQDTLPQGGFGNLIALPLQRRVRDQGNSVFIDADGMPYPDQWAFLAGIRRMKPDEVKAVVDRAGTMGGVLGIRFVSTDDDDLAPWLTSPSGLRLAIPLDAPLPAHIEIVLSAQIFVPKEPLPPVLRNRIIRLAAFQNPEFYKAQAMRFPTFGKPRIIHCCEDFPHHLGLPRGCLDDLLSMLRDLGVDASIQDERFSGNPIETSFTGELRPEQQRAADEMLRHDTGVLSASTAFGKTVVAVYVIAARAVNTLVLVHRKELLDQWVERLKRFLDLPEDHIGRIGAGKSRPSRLIDVAMIQTIGRKGRVDDIVADYGQIVVDECHHLSAPSFEMISRRCRARYFLGLSATVVRKDGHHPIVFMNCGPIRFRTDEKSQAAQRPFGHRVITRRTDFHLPAAFAAEARTQIQEVYRLLEQDDRRNEMIVQDVLAAAAAGRSPLLLSERKRHVQHLAGMLDGRVGNVVVLLGGMGRKQRRSLQQVLEAGTGAGTVIAATGKYLGEGFDDPRLDTLFLALPISWRGTLAQYAGRLHRVTERKREVLVYDYTDLQVPVLAKMYERRLKGYRAIGYAVEGD